jgi:hypothetical protein
MSPSLLVGHFEQGQSQNDDHSVQAEDYESVEEDGPLAAPMCGVCKSASVCGRLNSLTFFHRCSHCLRRHIAAGALCI